MGLLAEITQTVLLTALRLSICYYRSGTSVTTNHIAHSAKVPRRCEQNTGRGLASKGNLPRSISTS